MKHPIFLLLSLTSAGLAQAASVDSTFFQVNAAGNTLSITTTIPDRSYPSAGIKIKSSQRLISGCTMISNGYCTFGVSDTQAANITLSSGGKIEMTLCLNGNGPSSCQQYSSSNSKVAYINNYYASGAESVILCPILADGTFAPCQAVGDPGEAEYTTGIAINQARNFAYVPNYDSAVVSYCPLLSDGSLSSCSGRVALDYNDGGVSLNPSGTALYVPNFRLESIEKCTINSDGSLDACVDSGLGSIFNGSDGITFNKAGNLAYISNYNRRNDNSISVCNVDVSSGDFTACTPAGPSIHGPSTNALNQAETLFYITGYSNDTVTVCSVDPSDGTLNSCQATSYTFAEPWTIVLDEANSKAYVTNTASSTVSLCSIDQNGLLASCTELNDPLFSGPAGIVLED